MSLKVTNLPPHQQTKTENYRLMENGILITQIRPAPWASGLGARGQSRWPQIFYFCGQREAESRPQVSARPSGNPLEAG